MNYFLILFYSLSNFENFWNQIVSTDEEVLQALEIFGIITTYKIKLLEISKFFNYSHSNYRNFIRKLYELSITSKSYQSKTIISIQYAIYRHARYCLGWISNDGLLQMTATWVSASWDKNYCLQWDEVINGFSRNAPNI